MSIHRNAWGDLFTAAAAGATHAVMLALADVDILAFKAAASALNPLTISRVYSAPTTDSTGAPALLVTIVLPDDYQARWRDGGPGDAIVGVHEALERAGDDRLPILVYATERDLADSGGS